MDTSQLTAEQLEVLSKKMAEILLYLHNLQNRMEQRRFAHDDELYRLVRDANDKVHRLRVKVHYEYCDRKRQR